MKQLSIFDVEIQSAENKKLLPVEHFILRNLKYSHLGEENEYKTTDIIKDVKSRYNLEIDKTTVVKYIRNIRLHREGKTMISTGKTGYYIPITEKEVENAMNLLWKRFEKSMMVLAEQDSLKFQKKVLGMLFRISKKIDKPLDYQTQIKITEGMRGEIHYGGKHYLQNEQNRV